MGRKAEEDARRVRRLEAVQLRVKGMTFEEIGKRQGTSAPTAMRDVHQELAEQAKRTEKSIAELRALELIRLEDRERRIRKRLDALGEDLEDDERADRILDRIAKRRASLLGLDAPQRTESNITSSSVVRFDDLGQMSEDQLRAVVAGPAGGDDGSTGSNQG